MLLKSPWCKCDPTCMCDSFNAARTSGGTLRLRADLEQDCAEDVLDMHYVACKLKGIAFVHVHREFVRFNWGLTFNGNGIERRPLAFYGVQQFSLVGEGRKAWDDLEDNIGKQATLLLIQRSETMRIFCKSLTGNRQVLDLLIVSQFVSWMTLFKLILLLDLLKMFREDDHFRSQSLGHDLHREGPNQEA